MSIEERIEVPIPSCELNPNQEPKHRMEMNLYKNNYVCCDSRECFYKVNDVDLPRQICRYDKLHSLLRNKTNYTPSPYDASQAGFKMVK